MSALFELGVVVATPGALEVLSEAHTLPVELLRRHVAGDWGELDAHDRRENELSVREGYRILSAYTVGQDRIKLWVLTEADRSSTTLLLPSEY